MPRKTRQSKQLSSTKPFGEKPRTFVVANWKMALTTREAEALARELMTQDFPESIEVAICPSFPALYPVGNALKSATLLLGAQDVFWQRQGPFTGEVAAEDLRELGCRYVIVGHSERRREYHETDTMIHQKMLASLGHGLSPILCVGETSEERYQKEHQHVVAQQVNRALHNLPPPRHNQELVIAYEPVWAISPGPAASPQEAQEMVGVVRQAVLDNYNHGLQPRAVRILYGGNVTPENVRSFVDDTHINGVLVGAASLRVETFTALIQALAQAD